MLCIFLPSSCMTTSQSFTPKTSNSRAAHSKLNNIKIEDVDKNNDKVIDKEELEAYQHRNSPDSSTPLYVILLICGLTSLVCLLPKTYSFVKKKIKK